MTALHWQKSSYSSEHGNCVELAGGEGGILLRESDIPATVARTSRVALRSLLLGVKADEFGGPGPRR